MIAIFPEIIASARSGHVEQVAILVRKYFAGSKPDAPLVNLPNLATEAGIILKRVPLKDFGALLAQDKKGVFTITMLIRENLDEVTERFLIAHMLGHYFLKLQPLIAASDCQVTGYQELTCPMQRYAAHGLAPHDPNEGLADEFAAALLLPRGMVKKAAEVLDDLDKIAHFFGVHKICVARRLSDIQAPPKVTDTPKETGEPIRGMARLREIARQLDKSRTI